MKLDGAKLVAARHRKGMSQEELAFACGLTKTTISYAENGRDVYPSTGKKICTALEIDLAVVVLPEERENGDAA